ncbi:hypothetical protein [Pantoea sp.]|uniref:hypothetical protein n=1 Tax=Pantoea sp. TaxID=69393 RepID=UPI0028A6C6C3|nr:hypothetical protein [Pantoea sp.]
MLQLKQWHQAIKLQGGTPEDSQMEMRRFHRTLYLAGLQLQLLNPLLCSHIAESLGREGLTLDDLCQELSSAGLLAAGEAAPAEREQAKDSADFSKQQLRQLRALMCDALQRQPPAALDEASREELTQLRSEVVHLKTLLEQQTRLLRKLSSGVSGGAIPAESAKNGQTEEIALSSLSAPAQKMKAIRQKGIF